MVRQTPATYTVVSEALPLLRTGLRWLRGIGKIIVTFEGWLMIWLPFHVVFRVEG